ncbi:unnamed protein product [Soboliphyme baturini]|uniref:Transposase n=1 Tax=Soboliphyme baturini TaxID=241478 RepID=A0A183ING6_9BILA|nr:unnamed protein product [Soboliphyme baturini]
MYQSAYNGGDQTIASGTSIHVRGKDTDADNMCNVISWLSIRNLRARQRRGTSERTRQANNKGDNLTGDTDKQTVITQSTDRSDQVVDHGHGGHPVRHLDTSFGSTVPLTIAQRCDAVQVAAMQRRFVTRIRTAA